MTDIQLPAGPPRRREEMGGPGQPAREPGIGDSDLATLAGVAAVVFPLVYFASELVEVAQGNFTTGRLALTYIGEVRAGAAALPQAAFVGMGVTVLQERWRARKLRAIGAR